MPRRKKGFLFPWRVEPARRAPDHCLFEGCGKDGLRPGPSRSAWQWSVGINKRKTSLRFRSRVSRRFQTLPPKFSSRVQESVFSVLKLEQRSTRLHFVWLVKKHREHQRVSYWIAWASIRLDATFVPEQQLKSRERIRCFAAMWRRSSCHLNTRARPISLFWPIPMRFIFHCRIFALL